MADFQKRDRLIDFEGGVLTDAPAVLRPVEEMINLLPPQGFEKGLDPRDGIEALIKLESQNAPHTGIGIFEVTLDDCARQKILVLMDKATGEYRLITKHTDQEGRVSIPPEGGGELPITPEAEPVFGNLMYFAAATAMVAAGASTEIVVEAANAGGTCDWGVDFVTAEPGVDLNDQTGTVTADESQTGTVTVAVSADATAGRTFDVYLGDPAAVDTYLKNPTVCRVTITERDLRPLAFRSSLGTITETTSTVDVLFADAWSYETEEITLNVSGARVFTQDASRTYHGRQPLAQTQNYIAILTLGQDAVTFDTTYYVNCFSRNDIAAGILDPCYVWSTEYFPHAVIGDGGDKFLVLNVDKTTISGEVDESRFWTLNPATETATLVMEAFLPAFNTSSWSMYELAVAKDNAIFFEGNGSISGVQHLYFKADGTSGEISGTGVTWGNACKNATYNFYGMKTGSTGELVEFDYSTTNDLGTNPSDLTANTPNISFSGDGNTIIFGGTPTAGTGQTVQIYEDLDGTPASIFSENFAALSTGSFPLSYFVDGDNAKVAVSYDWSGVSVTYVCDVATGEILHTYDITTLFPVGDEWQSCIVFDPFGYMPRYCIPVWAAE